MIFNISIKLVSFKSSAMVIIRFKDSVWLTVLLIFRVENIVKFMTRAYARVSINVRV